MQKRALGKESECEPGLRRMAEGVRRAQDLMEIDAAGSKIELHGARYPEHLQKMVGR